VFDDLATGEISCNFYAVDLSTGVAEQRNTDPQLCTDGHTFSADGTLYAVANVAQTGAAEALLVTIDPATGAQSTIGTLPLVFTGALGMTFDRAGNLWLYAASSDPLCDDPFASCLWQVDPADASATFVGQLPGETTVVRGLTATCDDTVLAITDQINFGAGGSDSALESVDTGTGALTLLADTPDVPFPVGLDYDDAGGLWAIGGPLIRGLGEMQVHRIDPATGDATTAPITIGGERFEGFLAGLAVSPISCPEPTPEPVVIQPTFTG
jgi:hypothetical protein